MAALLTMLLFALAIVAFVLDAAGGSQPSTHGRTG